MKEKTEKILKPLDKIFTALKIICAIILVLFIIVLAFQRFSNNEKAIAGFRVFNVATGSMIPKYLVGDVLIVKEVDIDSLKVGDDITYLGKVGTFANRVVTHQIIEIEETANGKIYHTKGIANELEDPTITADQIYGKVIYKSLIMSFMTKLMGNMTAFYIVFLIPLAILIFLQIKDNKSEEDVDEDSEEYEDEDEDEYEDDEDDKEEYDEEDEDEEEE